MPPRNSTYFNSILQKLNKPISVYFIRHGVSVANQKRIIQGRADVSLSFLGKQQALIASEWFRNLSVPIQQVYSSALSRARVTGEIICDKLNISRPEICPYLLEIDTGIWSGKKVEDMRRKDPQLFDQFTQQSWEAIPEAESIDSLLRRAFLLWQYLVEQTNACTEKSAILCVSHSGFMQWIFKSTFNPTPRHWIPLIRVYNCGVFKFDYNPINNGNSKQAAHWSLINYPLISPMKR